MNIEDSIFEAEIMRDSLLHALLKMPPNEFRESEVESKRKAYRELLTTGIDNLNWTIERWEEEKDKNP